MLFRSFRKYWIDELPQILNVLKGDLNIVGCRPVSRQYFDRMPDELKNLRIKYKPGCFPPYLSFNDPNDIVDLYEIELKYLREKEKNPYLTDIKYLLKGCYNILFNKRRSS